MIRLTDRSYRCGYWRSTEPDSWYELGGDFIGATYGGVQVGTGPQHAVGWFGTPGSRFDLNYLNPQGFAFSEAHSVYRDETGVYITGKIWEPGGSGKGDAADEAVIWYNPVPEPSTFQVMVGFVCCYLAGVCYRKRITITT